MNCVDCFNGVKARKGSVGDMIEVNENNEDLLVIHPVVDGRLKDERRDWKNEGLAICIIYVGI